MKKHLLFICFANLDRSPCAEMLFENNEKYEAKSAGLSAWAVKPLTKHSLQWADYIFVMEQEQKREILEKFHDEIMDKPEIIVLNINNDYSRHDPELESELRERLKSWLEKFQ